MKNGDYILRVVLNNWLKGDLIKDFYLFESYVYMSKLLYNIDIIRRDKINERR